MMRVLTEKDILHISSFPQVYRDIYEEPDPNGQWMISKPYGPMRYSPMRCQVRPDLFSEPDKIMGLKVLIQMGTFAVEAVVMSVDITREGLGESHPFNGYSYGMGRKTVQVTFQPTAVHVNTKKEDKVKVYEAVVVKLNPEGVAEEVVKVVPPFTAPSAQAARDTVLFDYGYDNSIKGKDLTGYQVRTREFQVSTY